MGEVKNVPQLRFKEFNKGWDEIVLGDIAEFTKGKGISKADISEDGKTKCIRYGELYTTYGETINNPVSNTHLAPEDLVLSKVNDVIIPASGETQLDIATASCVMMANVALSGDLNIIRSNENGVFISYYLNSARKKQIASLAQGNSVVHLYSKQLKSLKLKLPTLPEQEKIANFLTAVDTKIATLTKKKTLLEQYKKGVMQQLFSHPSTGSGQELRFKKADGSDYPEWERKKLGEVLDYEQPTKYLVSSTEYDDSYNTPVLTAGKTFVLGFTDETNDIFKDDLPVILFDDFTTATQFVNFPFKAKSSAMKILKAKPKENVKFIYEVMQTIRFDVGGHGRHWISKYSTMNIKFPCIEEQTNIANFLSAIDQKIEATNTQIESTATFKKGLLQQMFV